MASAFAHAFSSIVFGKLYSGKKLPVKFWVLAMICAVFPDIDVLTFRWGIPYQDMMGHRGLTHSIFFAIIFGLLVVVMCFREVKIFSGSGIGLWLFFFICTASHGMLDAMTSGGYGVAFFAPFDDARYFFPWRPIKVSPLSIDRFFSKWGIIVIKSEMLWIGIPGILMIFGSYLFRKVFK